MTGLNCSSFYHQKEVPLEEWFQNDWAVSHLHPLAGKGFPQWCWYLALGLAAIPLLVPRARSPCPKSWWPLPQAILRFLAGSGCLEKRKHKFFITPNSSMFTVLQDLKYRTDSISKAFQNINGQKSKEWFGGPFPLALSLLLTLLFLSWLSIHCKHSAHFPSPLRS